MARRRKRKPRPKTYDYISLNKSSAADSLMLPQTRKGPGSMNKPWTNHFLYEHVSWIYACAHKIANSAFNSGYSVQTIGMKKETSPFTRGLDMLLKLCNQEQSFLEIYRQLHLDLAVNGKAYLAIKYLEDKPPFKYPVAFYRLDYRTIRPVYANEIAHKVADAKGLNNRIVAWVQEIVTDIKGFLEIQGRKNSDYLESGLAGGSNVHLFYPDEVLEFKLDATGTSPLDTLHYSLGAELAAQMYTFSYFKNSTKAGMILGMKEASEDDVIDNRKTLDNMYKNPDTAFQTMLLTGEMYLVRDSANTSDVQYLEIREFNFNECCAVMGTPPSLFGIGKDKGKGSDKEEDKLNFEEETVRPREKLILQRLVSHFYRLFPEQIDKFEMIPGIKGKASLHIVNIAQKALMSGRSINESRRIQGLCPVEGEDFDMPMMAVNIMPVELVKDMIENKNNKVGPDPVKDNNPGGQPGGSPPEDERSGNYNEQR